MRISTSKTPPTIQELASILQQEFSNQYSYSFLGLCLDKSLIVEKSTFVGAQISVRKNEISIEGSIPSLAVSIFSILTTYIFGFGSFGRSSSLKLEREIAYFLKDKYQ